MCNKVLDMSNEQAKCSYIPISSIREDKNHPGWGSCRTCTGVETCIHRLQEDFRPKPNHTWEAKATFEYAVMMWREEKALQNDGTNYWWLTVWAGGYEFVTSCKENPFDLTLDQQGILAERYAKERALLEMVQLISNRLSAAVDLSYGINSQTITILRRKSGSWGMSR